MVLEPWYCDSEWVVRELADGQARLRVPHPARAGLNVDERRRVDLRSAAFGYAVFAYADEEVIRYALGEYSIPKRLFALIRLPAFPAPLAVELVLENNEWVCSQLIVVRRPGEPPITQTLLREISFQRLIQIIGPRAADRLRQMPGGGLERVVAVRTPEGSEGFFNAAGAAVAQRRRGKRLDRAFLEQVADAYRRLVASGRRDPTRGVAEEFHAARSTAARWIAECRKRGILGPTAPGKKGERRPP
jgi:hypothetical protein